MVPATRRRVLHGALGLGALLAGCADRETTPTVETRDTDERVLSDPETVTLRSPTESHLVELSTPTETDPDRSGSLSQSGTVRGLIGSRERADRLSIADVDGADEARAFVSETDFSSETLGIETARVGECYRQELCHVIWSEIEYRTWFRKTYRDAHVACSVRNDDALTTLFRIPAALDAETVDRAGTGISRGGCRDPMPSGRRGGSE